MKPHRQRAICRDSLVELAIPISAENVGALRFVSLIGDGLGTELVLAGSV